MERFSLRPESVALDPGDHMDREEFHARYLLRPDIRRAELVQGVVYVPSPARIPEHGSPHNLLNAWIANYALRHPGLIGSSDGTVYLTEDDEVQPDVALFRESKGNARINDEHYLEGAPELVVEVAASSRSYDLHSKKESYRRAGVIEYVVWRTLDGAIDWFVLRDGQYEDVFPDDNGIIESHQFPGLRLPVARILKGDWAAILE